MTPGTENWETNRMNPWRPDDDPRQARRLGKTAEELGELQAVIARIQIQGMDGIDPSSGKTNRQRLIEETADVLAQLQCNREYFGISWEVIAERGQMKYEQMTEWEAHYTKEDQP